MNVEFLLILILAAGLLFFAAVMIRAVLAVVHDRNRPESLRDLAFLLARGVAYLTLAGGVLVGVEAYPVVIITLLGVFFLEIVGWRMRGRGIELAPDDADREEEEEDPPEPVPESDPQHIDPAGDLADAVESGDFDLSLADDQDAEDLREFVDAAEAQVRFARALLDDLGDGDTDVRDDAVDAATDGPADPPADAHGGDGGGETAPIDRDKWRDQLADTLAESGDLADRRANAILKMYDHLRRHGDATNDELRGLVDPDAVGYKDAESVWSNMVKGKDTLRALPGVEKPATGRNDPWRYAAEGGT